MPTFRLVAAFRQFYLFDDEARPPYPETITDADLEGRLKAVANLIAVYPESDAEIQVDVECVERPPNLDESTWAHIVEGPLSLPSGRVVLASPSSYLPECPRVPVSPGSYRVRVAASGGGGGERERYCISLWPSPAGPVAVIKSAGQHGSHSSMGDTMTRRVFFTRVSVLAILFGVASLVFSQSSPPTSEKADQTKALVNKAAALIESKGKAAFSEFRVKGSEWFHGDTYLFVYDLQSNVLLNPAFPAREGTKVTGQKDANGKLFHDAIIRVAETEGSGWVDYMFPKPGQTQPSQKWAYVKAVKIDGVPGLVASGFYPD